MLLKCNVFCLVFLHFDNFLKHSELYFSFRHFTFYLSTHYLNYIYLSHFFLDSWRSFITLYLYIFDRFDSFFFVHTFNQFYVFLIFYIFHVQSETKMRPRTGSCMFFVWVSLDGLSRVGPKSLLFWRQLLPFEM